jgi:hypothetical protein
MRSMNRKETPNRNNPPPDGPTYHQPLTVATRILCVVGAGVTLLAPYELLIKPGIPVFQLGMIPFWVIAGGALLVGLVFLAAAVFGFAKTVSFDRKRRQMILRADGIFRISRIWSYPFDCLGMPAVRADSSSDGPTVYRLEIPIDGRRRLFEIAVFYAEDTAKAEAERLRTLLDR